MVFLVITEGTPPLFYGWCYLSLSFFSCKAKDYNCRATPAPTKPKPKPAFFLLLVLCCVCVCVVRLAGWFVCWPCQACTIPTSLQLELLLPRLEAPLQTSTGTLPLALPCHPHHMLLHQLNWGHSTHKNTTLNC